jgi:hypothetical protein
MSDSWLVVLDGVCGCGGGEVFYVVGQGFTCS